MGIKLCANQGAGTPDFWTQKEATIGEILGIWTIFLSQTNGPNALIFGMKQPWDKEIQVVQIEFLGSWMAPPPEGGQKGEQI